MTVIRARKLRAAVAAGTLIAVSTGTFAQPSPPAPAAPASPATQAAEAHAGFFKSVQGTVRLTSPSGATRTARAGDAVTLVDRVDTEAGSGASLVLRDGTMMVIGPSSRVELKEFRFDSTTHDGGLIVSLLRGSLRMVTGLLGKKPDGIRVDTQTATIGIRGTDFIVTADDKS